MNEHVPTQFYWEAGSDHCPHGFEPKDDSPQQDAWWERHISTLDDIVVCLDAPAGEACIICSDFLGEMTLWADCQAREHARAKHGVVPNLDATHQPVTVLVGIQECFDRECEDYLTGQGNHDRGVELCSHIREETVCSCQRQNDGEYNNTHRFAPVPCEQVCA